jgi:DNA-binding Lrp family transcriptional regulator
MIPGMSGRRAKNVRPSSGAETLAPVDRSILAVLRENARLPNNAIAARVGVAPSTCLARIRSLEERGVISAITPTSTRASSAVRSRR